MDSIHTDLACCLISRELNCAQLDKDLIPCVSSVDQYINTQTLPDQNKFQVFRTHMKINPLLLLKGLIFIACSGAHANRERVGGLAGSGMAPGAAYR